MPKPSSSISSNLPCGDKNGISGITSKNSNEKQQYSSDQEESISNYNAQIKTIIEACYATTYNCADGRYE